MNELVINKTSELIRYDDLKWYQKLGNVAGFLILLLPPLGLYWIFKGTYKKGKDGIANKVGAIGKLYSTSYVIFFVSPIINEQFTPLAIINFIFITPAIHAYLKYREANKKLDKTTSGNNQIAKSEVSIKSISSALSKALNWHTERKLKLKLAERIRREKLNNILLCLVNNETLPITKWYNEQEAYKATELIPISVLYEKYLEIYDDILEELQSEGNVHVISKDLEFLNEGKLKAFFSHLAKIQEQNNDEAESDASWVDNNRGKIATGVAAASLFAGYKMARKKR